MIGTDIAMILSYPDTPRKVAILRDILSSIHLPILLVTHYPAPVDIVEMVDYYIYDKNDCPSGDYIWNYHYGVPGYMNIHTKNTTPYHGLSCLTSINNGISFLKDKFRNVHFFECDVLADYAGYIEYAKEKLRNFNFVGSEYYVPGQDIHGVITSFFSCDVNWFLSTVPDPRTWQEYKSYGANCGDYLMFENWLHNAVKLNGCHFFPADIWDKYIINSNIFTARDTERQLRAYISETDDHKILFIAHQYNGQKRTLEFQVNGEKVTVTGDNIYWRLFEKEGVINWNSAEQSGEFVIDPNKEYADTTFTFDSIGIKCLR